ncbi:hypothetical protein M431DRAFT_484472 [Trichoderma harzianum CBS 226.95]|uniref:Cation-transporting P-type ATPase C-terminal domain-containing protein n=1 Tax=Trichoderma harzianum CBS 226.95 TaxID=983964 RepID=A0A2T4A5U6_TRIHA|nr:hypothetical protein M431DRAFT_484472 [Trichoderma harzianum CBS 226.95]PTB52439.1 hypothetical protein M431DRAFT_484472 [Trichoderma harzianum CBS 226.95]
MIWVLLMALAASFSNHAWTEGGVDLTTDEALLMSESFPVPNNPKATFDDDTGPGDRLKVAYSSTTITKGCGCDVAFATGMYTKIGHIVSALQGEDLTGKGVEWEPRAAQPESVAKMWSKATMGWLSNFPGLTVGTPLQKKLVQLFLWLLAFAIVCFGGFGWNGNSCAPTEIAIEVFPSRSGLNHLKLSQRPGAEWSHIGEFPFDSEVKKDIDLFFLDTTTQEKQISTKTARATPTDVYILPSSEKIRIPPAELLVLLKAMAQEFDALSNDQIDALPQLPLVVTRGPRIFDTIRRFVLHVQAANIGFVISLLAGLTYKDNTAISVFLSTPVETIRMLPGTGAFSESGLGFETAVPDILNRLPRDVKFTPTLPQINMSTETPANSRLPHSSATASSLPSLCSIWSATGRFRAWLFHHRHLRLWRRQFGPQLQQRLFILVPRRLRYPRNGLHRDDVDLPALLGGTDRFPRPFFDMHQRVRAWGRRPLWGNWFLFFAITVVFFMIFPALYIPRLNAIDFMHTGSDWEWGFVFVAVIAFVVGAEAWKRTKRIYLRRSQGPTSTNGDAVVRVLVLRWFP